MKKLLLLLSIFTVLACSDDDSKPKASEVLLEGAPYTMDRMNHNPFDWANTYFEIIDSQGGTHMLRLGFPGITAMPNGTYTLLSNNDPAYDSSKNFAGGGFYFSNDEPPISVTSGTVRFSRLGGDKYKLTIDVETTQGSLEGTVRVTAFQM